MAESGGFESGDRSRRSPCRYIGRRERSLRADLKTCTGNGLREPRLAIGAVPTDHAAILGKLPATAHTDTLGVSAPCIFLADRVETIRSRAITIVRRAVAHFARSWSRIIAWRDPRGVHACYSGRECTSYYLRFMLERPPSWRRRRGC